MFVKHLLRFAGVRVIFLTFIFVPEYSSGQAAENIGQSCISEPDLESQRGQLAHSINLIRARQGLRPLKANSSLNVAAQEYACILAGIGQIAHIGPDGSTPADRVASTTYRACLVAENLAMGQPDPRAAIVGWMSSDGHRANILLNDATHHGYGLVRRIGVPHRNVITHKNSPAPARSRDEVHQRTGSLSSIAKRHGGEASANAHSVDRTSVDYSATSVPPVWVMILARPC